MGTLITALGIALALAADTLIFAWLFVRLPRRPVRYRTVLRGALFAAVGYEVLKVVGDLLPDPGDRQPDVRGRSPARSGC